MYNVTTKWVERMRFNSEIGNHIVNLDTTPPLGEDKGVSPKKLLLTSLAGCTGMDVVSLLEKMRVEVAKFEMETEAELTQEHPVVFSIIRLTYHFYGSELKKDKIEKAINLSKTKYCGVSAMLSKACPIEYAIEYHEQ